MSVPLGVPSRQHIALPLLRKSFLTAFEAFFESCLRKTMKISERENGESVQILWGACFYLQN